jgi:low affinity Fe/Cu permease
METQCHPVEEIGWQKGAFARAAHAVTIGAGSGGAVAGMVVVGLLWLGVGVAADFSRAWELCVTVGAPFLTLLLLVVVQHTQNHNNRAIQLKLDELISAVEGSHDGMVGIEEGSRTDLDHVRTHFQRRPRRGPSEENGS